VQRAEEAGVHDRLGRKELGRIAALEADAGSDAGLRERLFHPDNLAPLHRERLFGDDVLAVSHRADELIGVLVRIAGDVDGVDVPIGEHRLEIRVDLDRGAVALAEVTGGQGTRRPHGGDLALAGRVDRGNVGRRRPAVSDDGHVVRLAHGVPFAKGSRHDRRRGPQTLLSRACERQANPAGVSHAGRRARSHVAQTMALGRAHAPPPARAPLDSRPSGTLNIRLVTLTNWLV
jgi:hypothetical protein